MGTIWQPDTQAKTAYPNQARSHAVGQQTVHGGCPCEIRGGYIIEQEACCAADDVSRFARFAPQGLLHAPDTELRAELRPGYRKVYAFRIGALLKQSLARSSTSRRPWRVEALWSVLFAVRPAADNGA
jgi:hypothetical protein